jgi:hypothetical protein
MSNIFVLIGSILGFVSFAWRVVELITSHVAIDISVDPISGVNDRKHTTALVTIDNTGGTTRRIHYAAILIAPPKERVQVAIKKFVDQLGQGSPARYFDPGRSPLLYFRPDESQITEDGTHLLIPIPFFYQEQFTIGNEKISARLPIDTDSLAGDRFYNVYLMIFIQYPFRVYTRWRITSDALFLD